LFYLCWLCSQLSSSSQNEYNYSFRLEKNRFLVNQSDLLTSNVTTTFTSKLSWRWVLKEFLVQGWPQSFWKFSILSNILDLEWRLPNRWKIHWPTVPMFTCRPGKGGMLSSRASNVLYKPPGKVYIASYKEPLDQSDCWKLFVQLWKYTKLCYNVLQSTSS